MTASSLVEPAFCSIPPFARTLGPEVADLCDQVGFGPDPEQRLALDAIFGIKSDRTPSADEAAVVAPRQNIKTGLFKQCALGWLYITDERLVIWSAHEFSTSQEAHRDLTELIEGSDMLRRRVKTIHRGNGEEGIELVTGQRIKFKARTKTGGRGLTGDKVVLDEGFALMPSHMGSLVPTMSARPRGQILYGSSAGLVVSAVLRGVRDRGRTGGDPGLVYLEWCDDLEGGCADPHCRHLLDAVGCRLDDRRRWARANSQLGRRIEIKAIERERRSLPPEEFGRERLGWWDEDPLTGVLFPVGAWPATADDRSAISGPICWAVEVAQDRSWSCIGVSGARSDGLLHVQVAENHPGTNWVVDKLVELGATEVAIQPNSPAGSLIEDLEKRDIAVHAVSTTDYAQACGYFYDLVVGARLRHLVQGEVEMAVSAAVKRTVGDSWVLDRRGDVDISPLVCEVLAVHLASLERASVYEERGVRFL